MAVARVPLPDDKSRIEELERLLAERTAELEASERQRNDIAGITSEWIWETDDQHRLIAFGKGFEAHGVSAESIIGRTRWDLAGVDLATDPHWARHKADVDARRTFRGFRFKAGRPDGGELYLAASGVAMFDDAGRFQGYRGTVVDETATVSALRRAEAAQTMLADAIESASGALICNAEDVIVLSNDRLRDIFPDCAATLAPGGTYEAFFRDTVVKGHFPDAVGHEEAFVAERMVTHRAAAGATEYHVKRDRWVLLHERRMQDGGTVVIGLDITAWKRAQQALALSEERLDRAQRISEIGSWEADIATNKVEWSKEMYRIRGVPVGTRESQETARRSFLPEDAQRAHVWFEDLRAGVAREPLDVRIKRPDGEFRDVRFEGTPLTDETGKVVSTAGTMQDVTRRRLLERQLAQAQKMEAVGNLTGGLAHDFNNLLGVIVGNLDLLRDLVTDQAEVDELAKEALEAALRGADLTQRLLAFARRQPLHPERVDIGVHVKTTVELLRRTLGEAVEITLELAPDLWPAVVDSAQLEAALANLATNARDAMPKGGRLSFAVANAALDEDYAKTHIDVHAGDYVQITVSDNGVGMSKEVMARIFEPFFTTKPPGQGSGLGMAMVFGFMRQSGGHVGVYSEPGIGTVVRLYLPRDIGNTARAAVDTAASPAVAHGETVLAVEDNPQLLSVLVRQLDDLGYRVVTATTAKEALDVLANGTHVDLLLSDVVMPGGMTGIELAEVAMARHAELKVLLTSGFPDARIGGKTREFTGPRLLSKPYRRAELARRVREALDAPSGPAAMAGE